MTIYSLSMIYLGNITDLDPHDGDGTAENQNAMLGTYYGGGAFASDHIVTVTIDDANHDAVANSNDTATPDVITYDLGAGPVVTEYDAIFNVDVTVAFGPNTGEPDYNGIGGINQMANGDLFFVMVDDGEGYGTNSFDDVPIHSITANSILQFGKYADISAVNSQSFVPCFTMATRIDTRRGAVAVEDLRIGDAVLTLDDGFQPIAWIGCHEVSAHRLSQTPGMQPIVIRAGALGEGYPEDDLIVSPQHRVLLRSKIVRRMFGAPDALVPACKLVGYPGIHRTTCRFGLRYHHFLCERHQVVWANGAPAETLYLGRQAARVVALAAHQAVGRSPHFDVTGDGLSMPPARPFVQKGRKLKTLMARHLRNRSSLLQSVG